MANYVIVHNIIDPKTGLNFKQQNMLKQHLIAIDTLVELNDPENSDRHGLRLFVVNHGRDCDGTPLYGLSFHKSKYFKEIEDRPNTEIGRYFKGASIYAILDGWLEDSLIVIKQRE